VTLLNFRDFSVCKFFVFSAGFYGKSKKVTTYQYMQSAQRLNMLEEVRVVTNVKQTA